MTRKWILMLLVTHWRDSLTVPLQRRNIDWTERHKVLDKTLLFPDDLLEIRGTKSESKFCMSSIDPLHVVSKPAWLLVNAQWAQLHWETCFFIKTNELGFLCLIWSIQQTLPRCRKYSGVHWMFIKLKAPPHYWVLCEQCLLNMTVPSCFSLCVLTGYSSLRGDSYPLRSVSPQREKSAWNTDEMSEFYFDGE